jgi:hypothetical protein
MAADGPLPWKMFPEKHKGTASVPGFFPRNRNRNRLCRFSPRRNEAKADPPFLLLLRVETPDYSGIIVR